MTQPADALRLVPNMPTVELTDDMLFKIETGETVTWGELKRRQYEQAVRNFNTMREDGSLPAPESPLPEVGGQCSGISGELKSPDLDALEKLAESLATLDSEERDWPLVKIHGRMFHVETAAKAASDGLTALIAELKEARGLLEEVTDDLKSEIDARYDGMLPQLEARYSRDLSTATAARAFLARNGKGEG